MIRATEGEDNGEEYATLVTVYGKGKVGRPTTTKIGVFTVFKVMIEDGPDKDSAGAMYLFETGSGENRWKVKVRAVYPQANREEYIKQIEDVLAGFGIAPE